MPKKAKPPTDIPEPFVWKCPRKDCRMKGTARTKYDAELALELHNYMNHSTKK